MKTTITVTIPDEVIEDIWEDITSGEIFNTPFGAGYYLHGFRQLKDKSWLAVECDDKQEIPPLHPTIKLWLEHQHTRFPSVKRWYLLTEKTARQIAIAGVKHSGENWHEDSDLSTVEYLLQFVLFGKQKYG